MPAENSLFPHVYFVAFSHPKGAGNCEIRTELPLCRIEQVRNMEAWLRTQGIDQPVVTNYILLRTDS